MDQRVNEETLGMLSRRLLLMAVVMFGVTMTTACPLDIAKKIAEQDKLTKEYNDKVNEANRVSDDLLQYGLFIGMGNSGSGLAPAIEWSMKSDFERAQIRSKLNDYISLLSRVIELSNHDAVKDEVSDYSRSLQSENMASARNYLASLDGFEGKL